MAAIRVMSYAGSRAEEYPLHFRLHGRKIMIDRIVDSWLTPGCRCFKVMADNGNIYVLEYDEKNCSWRLLTVNRP